MDDDFDPLFDMQHSAAEEVLVDFESMGFAESVIVAADAPDELKDRVFAALLSFQMGVKSVDWVRKAHVDKRRRRRPSNDTWNIQAQIYRASAELLDQTFKELDPHRGDPTLGEYAASIVLERLRSSFFAAHMLYRLGRIIEAHAVSRFILEQIAWAYASRTLDTIEQIERVQPNRSIGLLNTGLLPGIGKVYGALSKYAHLAYELHHTVLTRKAGRAALLRADWKGAASHELVLLRLADSAAIVYEISQHRFMRTFDHIRRRGRRWILRRRRPIVPVHRRLKALASSADTTTQKPTNRT